MTKEEIVKTLHEFAFDDDAQSGYKYIPDDQFEKIADKILHSTYTKTIPFGERWEKEVSKYSKGDIIEMYKSVCIENIKIRCGKQPSALDLIAAEREKQISKGDTAQSDAENNQFCELSHAACVLADPYKTFEGRVKYRPEDWDYDRWVKMCDKDVKSRLIIAGALIAAQLDRDIYEENLQS